MIPHVPLASPRHAFLVTVLAFLPTFSASAAAPESDDPVWCRGQLEECLPMMREFFAEKGNIAVSFHVSHQTVGPQSIRADGPVLAVGVTPGGPGDRAGVRNGDQIVALNDHVLGTGRQAQETLKDLLKRPSPVGSEIRVRLLRAGEELELTIISEPPPEVVVNSRLHYYIFDVFGPEEAERFRTANPIDWPMGEESHDH